MLKICTVFPYGLNDQLGDDFIKENTHVLIRQSYKQSFLMDSMIDEVITS